MLFQVELVPVYEVILMLYVLYCKINPCAYAIYGHIWASRPSTELHGKLTRLSPHLTPTLRAPWLIALLLKKDWVSSSIRSASKLAKPLPDLAENGSKSDQKNGVFSGFSSLTFHRGIADPQKGLGMSSIGSDRSFQTKRFYLRSTYAEYWTNEKEDFSCFFMANALFISKIDNVEVILKILIWK